MHISEAVPTNIITGALGVGKTTLIQHLLTQKPENERWAVLINEFGEIGMDAAILHSQYFKKDELSTNDITVREVPGGCMCCTSGITMQIALNQLLALAKPDRLLIEPTGLGHPKEVIQTLKSKYYKDIIRLENTLCLVDARKLANEKWREHDTFKEQFQVADHIVLTKSDLYQGNEEQQLADYLSELALSDVAHSHADKGAIMLSLLHKARSQFQEFKVLNLVTNSTLTKVGVNDMTLESQEKLIVRKEKQSEGFYSRSWSWSPEHWFDCAKVISVIKALDVVRLKAILITEDGIFSFNVIDGEIDIQEHDEAFDSRMELITSSELSAIKAEQSIEHLIS
ncbi:MAG: GTP-binding protein [Glaciecola sp.]|nr:GTP-binding protein [Glaciecola sp.]